MCVWVSSLGEERPLGRAGVEAGRVGPSLLTSPPGRARACISWGQSPPAAAGDIELGGAPWGGHLTFGTVPAVPCRGLSCGPSREGGPEQAPRNPVLAARTLSIRSLGIPWAPAGQAEGEEGGCLSE